MKKTYRFNKEDSSWYIDLPEYIKQGGSKAALQMVAGADTFLDLMAEGKHSVDVTLSTTPFEGADKLELVKDNEYMSEAGADYFLRHYQGEAVNRKMWLCAVTLFVFDAYPQEIYIRKEP